MKEENTPYYGLGIDQDWPIRRLFGWVQETEIEVQEIEKAKKAMKQPGCI